jgi:hypothetical protein
MITVNRGPHTKYASRPPLPPLRHWRRPFDLATSRIRPKLESPRMSLNLKTKIQGLDQCPGIYKEVLESPWILLALVYGYFLKLFDIQNGHFVVEFILFISCKTVWNSLNFEKFNVTFYRFYFGKTLIIAVVIVCYSQIWTSNTQTVDRINNNDCG